MTRWERAAQKILTVLNDHNLTLGDMILIAYYMAQNDNPTLRKRIVLLANSFYAEVRDDS